MRSRLLPTRPREGADDGVDCVAGASRWPTAISTEPRCTQLTPSSAERARRERRHPKTSTPEELPPLMMWTTPPSGHLVPKGGRLSATTREAVHAEIYPNWRRHRQEFLSSPRAGERRLFRHET